MTRLLRFDPLQRATEFICRLMLEAGACVRKCPEGQTIAGGWAHAVCAMLLHFPTSVRVQPPTLPRHRLSQRWPVIRRFES